MNCSVRSSLDNGFMGEKGGCHKGGSVTFSYTAERVIGNGSFGVVYQATSAETGNKVAIKKVFQDRRYKNRELQIMKDLGDHPNIVRLHHAFYSDGDKPDELFLNVVMDYVPETVHKLLKTYQKLRQPFPTILAKIYTYQLCRGLAFVHAGGVCHRDIKPQNLLICPRTHALKLCDFGSAKRLVPGENNVSYICSRYYRAPELIFGAVEYGHAVDLWSMGCVLGELIQGAPLFHGENGVDQLVQIIKVLGTPSKEELLKMNPHYSAEFRFPFIKRSSRLVKGGCTVSDEVLGGLLQYDPYTRLNCSQVLASDWFKELRHAKTIETPTTDGMKGFELDLFDFSPCEMDYLNRLFKEGGEDRTVDLCLTRMN